MSNEVMLRSSVKTLVWVGGWTPEQVREAVEESIQEGLDEGDDEGDDAEDPVICTCIANPRIRDLDCLVHGPDA